MKRKTTNHLAALVMLLAGLCFTSGSIGQTQVNTNGQVHDASNRIGSGGLNIATDPTTIPGNNQLTTNVMNGTVTGGWGFRGHIPYSPPGAFHGQLPSAGMDQFIQSSSGGFAGQNNSQRHVAYYGQGLQYAPPGFVRDPNGGGYVAPSPLQEAQAISLNAPLDPGSFSPLPLAGQLATSGQVDPTAANAQVLTMASPLYGIRQWQANAAKAAADAANNPTQTPGEQPTIPTTPTGPLSQEQIIQIRQQLYKSVVAPVPPAGQLPATQLPDNAVPSGALTPVVPGVLSSNPLSPANPNPQLALKPLTVPGQGMLAPIKLGPDNVAPSRTLPTAAQQSSQYADLERRLEAFDAQHPVSQEQLDAQLKAIREHRPLISKPIGTQPVVPGPTTVTPLVKPKTVAPLRMQSLAAGIEAKELANLMSNAETLMHDQRYDKAIEQYNAAEQVAPNNPLIPLGRAIAELGGLYFVKAEADLRTAMTSGRAILQAQVDLDHLYGSQQREVVIGQLKRLADEQKNNPTPLFLLAYISYNAQDVDKAQELLAEAQRRAGGSDALITFVQRHWAPAPTTQPSTRPAGE